nr:G protein-coupled receptor [Proales similis]
MAASRRICKFAIALFCIWLSTHTTVAVVGLCILDHSPLDLISDGEISCSGFNSLEQIYSEPIQIARGNEFDLPYHKLNLYPSSGTVLSNQLDLEQLVSRLTQKLNSTLLVILDRLQAINIDGIDLNFKFSTRNKSLARITELKFDFFDFTIYLNKTKLDQTNCNFDTYTRLNEDHYEGNIFDLLRILSNAKYHADTCVLIFLNTSVNSMEISGISNSMIGRNVLEFVEIFDDRNSLRRVNLKSTIGRLDLSVFQVPLTLKLLSAQVFAKTHTFEVSGKLSIVQSDAVYQFKIFALTISNMKQFLHSNHEWYQQYVNSTQFRVVQFENNHMYDFLRTDSALYTFPNEDFCVFARYPNNSKTFFFFHSAILNRQSCTQSWLMKNRVDMSSYLDSYPWLLYEIWNEGVDNLSQYVDGCDFAKRLALCSWPQVKQFPTDFTLDSYKIALIIHLIKFISVVFILPLICFVSIVSNLIVVKVLQDMIAKFTKKRFDETSKKARLMYIYLKHQSMGGVLLCCIHLLRPLTECVGYADLFCSPLFLSIFARFLEAFAFNMLGSALKLFTTFCVLFFSIMRLSINVGKSDHPALSFFISLKPSLVSVITLLFCLLLSTIKLFVTDDYSAVLLSAQPFSSILKPFIFDTSAFSFNRNVMPVFELYLTFEIFTDVFVPSITLLIDLLLYLKMQKVNQERAKRFNQDQTDREKNEKNMMTMIVFNAVFSILLRAPLFLLDIFSAQITRLFGGQVTLRHYCHYLDYPLLSICPNLISVCNALYLSWFFLNFILLLKFNRAFRKQFNKKFRPQTHNKEVSEI